MLGERYKLKVNKYGDVKGVPGGWVKIPGDDTARYADKDIPIYTANVGFINKWARKIPLTVTITHMDYLEKVERINEAERIKDDEYVSQALSDNKTIIDALSAIDNEVKRQQDVMEAAKDKAYGHGKKKAMSKTKDISAKRSYFEAREEKNKLSALKDKAIKRMIDEWGASPSEFLPVNRAVKAIEAFVVKGNADLSNMKEAKRTKEYGGIVISKESKGEWFF